jgi:hypothetical protein
MFFVPFYQVLLISMGFYLVFKKSFWIPIWLHNFLIHKPIQFTIFGPCMKCESSVKLIQKN